LKPLLLLTLQRSPDHHGKEQALALSFPGVLVCGEPPSQNETVILCDEGWDTGCPCRNDGCIATQIPSARLWKLCINPT
jgi:hypothetical protein